MKTIARYEANGKKQWLELYETEFNGKLSYEYSGTKCGGNIGYKNSPQDAIQSFEINQVQYLKMDYPSTKRVF